ncbi:hypothetical protein BD413DRAFT_571519 [Trametes elegans]|nr:hypothetical protein BD413DRAFT_571519 [Trametes elegans]
MFCMYVCSLDGGHVLVCASTMYLLFFLPLYHTTTRTQPDACSETLAALTLAPRLLDNIPGRSVGDDNTTRSHRDPTPAPRAQASALDHVRAVLNPAARHIVIQLSAMGSRSRRRRVAIAQMHKRPSRRQVLTAARTSKTPLAAPTVLTAEPCPRAGPPACSEIRAHDSGTGIGVHRPRPTAVSATAQAGALTARCVHERSPAGRRPPAPCAAGPVGAHCLPIPPSRARSRRSTGEG